MNMLKACTEKLGVLLDAFDSLEKPFKQTIIVLFYMTVLVWICQLFVGDPELPQGMALDDNNHAVRVYSYKGHEYFQFVQTETVNHDPACPMCASNSAQAAYWNQ